MTNRCHNLEHDIELHKDNAGILNRRYESLQTERKDQQHKYEEDSAIINQKIAMCHTQETRVTQTYEKAENIFAAAKAAFTQAERSYKAARTKVAQDVQDLTRQKQSVETSCKQATITIDRKETQLKNDIRSNENLLRNSERDLRLCQEREKNYHAKGNAATDTRASRPLNYR